MPSRLSLLGIAISVVCLIAVIAWAVRQPAPELPDTSSQLWWLAAAVTLYAINTAVRAERWHQLLLAAGAAPQRSDSYALTVIGYTGNNVLPARAGDAVRVVLLAPRAETAKRTVIGTLLAERILDVIIVVLLFVVIGYGILGEVSGGDVEVVAIATAIAIAAAVLALWMVRRNERLLGLVEPVLRSTIGLRSGHGMAMIAISLVIWAIEAGVWIAVGGAVGFEMSVLEGLYLVGLSSIFSMIPSGPSYAGTQDAAAVLGIKAIGGSSATAVSYIVMLRFVLMVPITTTGLILLAVRYGGIGRLRQSREAMVDA